MSFIILFVKYFLSCISDTRHIIGELRLNLTYPQWYSIDMHLTYVLFSLNVSRYMNDKAFLFLHILHTHWISIASRWPTVFVVSWFGDSLSHTLDKICDNWKGFQLGVNSPYIWHPCLGKPMIVIKSIYKIE